MKRDKFEKQLTELTRKALKSADYQVNRSAASMVIVLGMFMEGKAHILSEQIVRDYVPTKEELSTARL